jgi:hypothetical protein
MSWDAGDRLLARRGRGDPAQALGCAVQTSPDGPRRTPPAPALLAAPLALVTALAVGFFSVLAVAFSNGQFGGSRCAAGCPALGGRPAGGTNPQLTGPPRGPSFGRSLASYLRGRVAPVWSGGTGPS